MARKNPQNEAKRADREVRKLRAFELRRDAFTEQQIARELGVGQSTVSRYLTEVLADMRERGVQTAEDWRAIEMAKLDRRERAALQVLTDIQPAFASSGKIVTDVSDDGRLVKLRDYQTVLQAIGKLNDISARRAKLLGLDQPTKIEQSGSLEVTTAYDLSKITDPEKVRQLMDLLAEAETDSGEKLAE